MSFYDFVKRIKSGNKDKITFVKCGVFFVCIGEDALIASEVLGLKRTCFSKQICKCGMPVSVVVNNLQKLEDKVKSIPYGIVIYYEMEKGNFEYNNKKYGILWEHKGNKIIEEKRLCLDCNECKAGEKRYGEGKLSSKEYQEIMKELEQLKSEVAKLKTQGKLVIKGKKHKEENPGEVK